MGANGTLRDSTFIDNTATLAGGGVVWYGNYGLIINSNFSGNNAIKENGGGVCFEAHAVNITITGCIFINNVANWIGGGLSLWGTNSTVNNCIFINNAAQHGGGLSFAGNDLVGTNGSLTNSSFMGNTATYDGGAVSWMGANSNMHGCNFTDNHAVYGDNVYWRWNVEDFLNKYSQINDFDYVYILNGVGTPSNTIILNKKGVTISGQSTNVIFDAKGGNFHFEVTGEGVLIEKITFRNFNFSEDGGAIEWIGRYGILRNCNFINNSASRGGAIQWSGSAGNISDSFFINNTANSYGGAIRWYATGGTVSGSTFTSNTANNWGGAIIWYGDYGKVCGSIFTSNAASNGVEFTGFLIKVM